MPPAGIILHSTRSGRDHDEAAEFDATMSYVRAGAGGLGWNVTVGPGQLGVHLGPGEWGWNAREHSPDYLAIEFAQSRPRDHISDEALDVAAWWVQRAVRPLWPSLPHVLVSHSMLPAGRREGKSDPYPADSLEEAAFRARFTARLGW